MAIFILMFGATLGSAYNQAKILLKGRSIIKYQYAGIAIPFMFCGGIMGIFLNKMLPSIFIVSITLITIFASLKKIYIKACESYKK